jgi:N-acetyl-gamma-glutamyl-phosphate reductase
MHDVPRLLDAGVRVLDLSADFRLRDLRLWEHWYKTMHAAPEYIERAVYGLPELGLRRRIAAADLVACPGCYPTAILLGFKPLIEARVVDPARLIADAKTGVSGAGMKLATPFLYGEVSDSFKAYGVAGHRHLPEIQQELQNLVTGDVGLTFVPHLVPMVRGIHATLYATLTATVDLQSLFERAYADESFVDVLPAGATPETRHVRATNMCRMAVHRPLDGNQVVVLATIDNLVKGAAGQAVQCFNLMIGAPESQALGTIAPVP